MYHIILSMTSRIVWLLTNLISLIQSFTNINIYIYLWYLSSYREFEAYMSEVKKVPGIMSEGKREVINNVDNDSNGNDDNVDDDDSDMYDDFTTMMIGIMMFMIMIFLIFIR